MLFCGHFFEKWQIRVSEPHFGKVMGDAWLLVDGSFESPWSTFYSP